MCWFLASLHVHQVKFRILKIIAIKIPILNFQFNLECIFIPKAWKVKEITNHWRNHNLKFYCSYNPLWMSEVKVIGVLGIYNFYQITKWSSRFGHFTIFYRWTGRFVKRADDSFYSGKRNIGYTSKMIALLYTQCAPFTVWSFKYFLQFVYFLDGHIL